MPDGKNAIGKKCHREIMPVVKMPNGKTVGGKNAKW